jgi:hypothetical protein
VAGDPGRHDDGRGTHVHGVHPGTTLGRYTLSRRVDERPTSERWLARDTDLDRDVVLHVLPADHEHAEAALDAARRASGIGHPGLVRVLDVDTDGAHAWITEAYRPDDRPLCALIGSGLPAEEIRRISGEVAVVLEAARGRGLHHLALAPESVLVGEDGSVRVRGLAVDAALLGIDDEDHDADAEDATAVVALAYAGLTGSWPLANQTSLPDAPRDATGVLPPSHLAVGVPSDLDTICRETLADDAGPSSPGDYAASIAPWSRGPVVDDEPPAEEASTPEPEPSSGTSAPDHRPGAEDTAVLPPAGAAAGGAAGGAAIAGAASGTGRPGGTDEAAGLAESSSPGTPPRRDTQDRTDTPRATDDSAEGPDSTGRPAAAAAAAAAAVAGTLSEGGKVLGERVGKVAQRTRERAETVAADRRAQRDAIRSSEARDRVSLGSAGGRDDLEAPAPLLPVEAGVSPSPEQSRTVLLIMAGMVTLALILGCFGVSRIGSNTDLGGIFGSDAQQAAPATTPTPAASPPADTAGGEPIQVLGAIGFDPDGDQTEHNSEAQRVYDNDVSTSWTSEGYNSPDFGNKRGVGIVLDLGQAQTITSATLQLPTATTVEVFVGAEPGITGSLLGKSEGKNGSVTVTGQQPTEGQYVTIWFTTTAQGSDGRHRASLAEVVLR